MGQVTTYSVVNYDGMIFQLNRKNTAFLRAIGALRNGTIRPVFSPHFECTTYDISANGTNGNNLEGQDAPTAMATARGQILNVVEIFHEQVNVSYTKQAAIAQMAAASVGTKSSVQDELPWQVRAALDSIALKVNNAFLNGAYSVGASDAARKTRGLISAIETNVVAADSGAGAADSLSKAYIDSLVKKWFDAGNSMGANAMFLCGSTQKLWLDAVYGKPVDSMNVGGVKLEIVHTALGSFPIMVDQQMPQDVLVIANMDVVEPVGLFVPGKGILFEEALAKTGAADRTQIYGELGLDHGPETYHAKLTNLVTALPTYA